MVANSIGNVGGMGGMGQKMMEQLRDEMMEQLRRVSKNPFDFSGLPGGGDANADKVKFEVAMSMWKKCCIASGDIMRFEQHFDQMIDIIFKRVVQNGNSATLQELVVVRQKIVDVWKDTASKIKVLADQEQVLCTKLKDKFGLDD